MQSRGADFSTFSSVNRRSTCVRCIYGIYRCCTHPSLFLFPLPGQAGCLCPAYCHASPLADPGPGHRRGIRRRCRASMKMKRMKSEVISATIESYLKRRHYQVQCRGDSSKFHAARGSP